MNESHFLDKIAASLNQHATVSTVFGEPIRSGERIVIPVARVMLGLGGGYGHGMVPRALSVRPDMASAPLAEHTEPGAEGAGGGGGMRVIARGVYEITPTGTRFIPVFDTRDLLLGVGLGLLLCRLVVKGLSGNRH